MYSVQSCNDLILLLNTCRYEWVDVGMMDYKSDTKMFLVKRVYVPNHVLEANAKKKEKLLNVGQKSQIKSTGSASSLTDNGSTKPELESSGSEGQLEEDKKRKTSGGEGGNGSESSGSEGEAGPASDGEQRAHLPQLPQQEVS